MGSRGLCFLEILAGVAIVALAGIHDALEAFEGGAAAGEGVAGPALLDFVRIHEELAGGAPEFGFDATETAEAPFVVDHGIDEETFIGVGGAVEFVVFGGEFGEIFGGFGEHDLMLGMDAVLQGVEARIGFAFDGNWTF